MYDVVTIGSSLVDTFVKTIHLTVTQAEDGSVTSIIRGDKVSVDEYQIHTGGGASNTGVGFARMGLKTAIISELGQDILSSLVIKDLTSEHVSTSFLIQEKKEQTGGSVILLGDDGTRTVLVHRGAASQLDPHDITSASLSQTRWIHLSSIGGNRDTLQKIFEEKPNTTPLSWNPGQSEIAVLSKAEFTLQQGMCEILFVNANEWQSLQSVHDSFTASIPTIVVTDGGKGGMIFTEGKWRTYQAVANTTVDVTGAGDSFVVGFVAAVLDEKPVEIATQWGARNAASVVASIGAKPGLLVRDAIE